MAAVRRFFTYTCFVLRASSTCCVLALIQFGSAHHLSSDFDCIVTAVDQPGSISSKTWL